MEIVQFEDLLAVYPSIPKDNYEEGEPGYQTMISAKREFSELSSLNTGPVKQGVLFNHQEFVKRYMIDRDRLLLLNDPGTGKTCAFIGLSEELRRQYKENLHQGETQTNLEGILGEGSRNITNPRLIKGCLIIVKNKTLIQEIRNQIVCVCSSPDAYANTERLQSANTEQGRKKVITSLLSEWYEIITFNILSRRLSTMIDEDIKRIYSNLLIVIDEVHNLRNNPIFVSKKINIINENSEDDENEEKARREDDPTGQYYQLKRLCKNSDYSKIILSSATIAVNVADEVRLYVNMLIHKGLKEMPRNLNYNNASLEVFEPYFRGIVSYIKRQEIESIVNYVGSYITLEDDTTLQTKIWAIELSEFQQEKYKLIYNKEKSAIFKNEKEIINFLFPDGSWGNKGFEKYIDKERLQPKAIKKGNNSGQDFIINVFPHIAKYGWSKRKVAADKLLENKDDIQEALDILSKYSSKYAEIINKILEERNKPLELRGNNFLFFEQIEGSGAIMFGICLEAFGFSLFNSSGSIFKSSNKGGDKQKICGTSEIIEDRSIEINKEPRYFILSNKTTPKEYDVVREAFNSYENRHGDYINIFITGPKGKEGINLNSVLNIFLVSGGWNQATVFQAESRAIRGTISHRWLLDDMKKYTGDNNSKIKINVYKVTGYAKDFETIDIYSYRIIEQKDISIKKMLRIMYQSAVDCQINLQKNIRIGVDYSAECFYDKCIYTCANPNPNYIDNTTYDIIYSRPLIESIKKDIIDLLPLKVKITVNELYDIFYQRSRKFVDLAIYELNKEKSTINNVFGFKSYIHFYKGILFLDSEYPYGLDNLSNIADTEYIIKLFTVDKQSLENIIENNIDNTNIIEEIIEIYENNLDWKIYIDKLYITTRIKLLEDLLISDYINKEDILKYFKGNYLFMNDPIILYEEERNNIRDNTGKQKKGPGRPKIQKIDYNDQYLINLPLNKDTEIVIAHKLSSNVNDNTSYAATSKSKKLNNIIRIYIKNEGVWRNSDEIENIVWNLLFRRDVALLTLPFEEYDFYGLYLSDEPTKFRIRDKQNEIVRIKKGGGIDNRTMNRGKDCITMGPVRVAQMLTSLASLPKSKINKKLKRYDIEKEILQEATKTKYTKGHSNNTLTKDILSNMDEDDLYNLYSWYTNYSIIELCDNLKNKLEDVNRILRL